MSYLNFSYRKQKIYHTGSISVPHHHCTYNCSTPSDLQQKKKGSSTKIFKFVTNNGRLFQILDLADTLVHCFAILINLCS